MLCLRWMKISALKSQFGMTMIELLIVVTLSAMLLLAASAVFMTFLIGGAKINSQSAVKQEGEYALTQIEFLLRNAVELLPNTLGDECTTDMADIRFVSFDGGITTLSGETADSVTKIASNSGVFLTSSSVDVIDGPTFDCAQDDDEGHPHVTTTFTLRKGSPGVDQDRDIVEQVFSGSTNIRSL